MIGGITTKKSHVNKLMGKYHAAIDQGTSSGRVCLFEELGKFLRKRPVYVHQIQMSVHVPLPGYSEQDPEDIYKCILECVQALPHTPESISITNQRESVIAWDRLTGKSLHKAICKSVCNA